MGDNLSIEGVKRIIAKVLTAEGATQPAKAIAVDQLLKKVRARASKPVVAENFSAALRFAQSAQKVKYTSDGKIYRSAS